MFQKLECGNLLKGEHYLAYCTFIWERSEEQNESLWSIGPWPLINLDLSSPVPLAVPASFFLKKTRRLEGVHSL